MKAPLKVFCRKPGERSRVQFPWGVRDAAGVTVGICIDHHHAIAMCRGATCASMRYDDIQFPAIKNFLRGAGLNDMEIVDEYEGGTVFDFPNEEKADQFKSNRKDGSLEHVRRWRRTGTYAEAWAAS